MKERRFQLAGRRGVQRCTSLAEMAGAQHSSGLMEEPKSPRLLVCSLRKPRAVTCLKYAYRAAAAFGESKDLSMNGRSGVGESGTGGERETDRSDISVTRGDRLREERRSCKVDLHNYRHLQSAGVQQSRHIDGWRCCRIEVRRPSIATP